MRAVPIDAVMRHHQNALNRWIVQGGGAVDVQAMLGEAIGKICGIPVADVTPATPLEDLGVDSLAVAEIVVELEMRLDRELPVHVLRQFDGVRTVGDVANVLGAALDELVPEA
jgi:acyl carrier protein